MSWQRERVLKFMDDAIYTLEYGVENLKRAKKTFEQFDAEGREDAADSIGWFVNDMKNTSNNLRYDSVVHVAIDYWRSTCDKTHQLELTELRKQLHEALEASGPRNRPKRTPEKRVSG